MRSLKFTPPECRSRTSISDCWIFPARSKEKFSCSAGNLAKRKSPTGIRPKKASPAASPSMSASNGRGRKSGKAVVGRSLVAVSRWPMAICQRPSAIHHPPTTNRPMSKEWNATLYHQISAPQVSWGKKVLARVKLRGNERVLDAGCGTGRLTRDLLEALPRGHVVALDVSENMLDAARAYLEPDFGSQVEFARCDLLELPFECEFDLIFSTASFHWVLDHDRLFRNLYRALRREGSLIAQCGGGNNLARLLARVV